MKTLRIVLVGLVALLAGVVASGHAQTLLFTLDSPNPQPGGRFGAYTLAVGDVDGDGKGDIAVGALHEDVGGISDAGRAYVFSGADGSVLLTLDTPNPQGDGYFGNSVAVGEVNGDGRADIVVGAYFEDVGGNADQGRAYVFSGADGSLLFTLDTPNPQVGGRFGSEVAVGDVNGDGKADIAVGARQEDVGGTVEQGRAYVFSGADGSLLLTLDSSNPQAGSMFGRWVAVGQVNGDGKADIAVAAHEEDVGGNANQGRAYVFSGADGSLLFTLDSANPEAGGCFGFPVAVGDVNGDGKGDVAVGAPSEDVGGNTGQGRAYVFSGADGSLLFTLDTPNPQPELQFGYRLAVGEVNGDGRAEMAVTAHEEDVGGNVDQGRAYVFSGADGSLLFSLDIPNPRVDARFGMSVAVGDVNADGRGEIAVGAHREDVGANAEQGRAYVFSSPAAPPTPTPTSTPTPTPTPPPGVGGIVEMQVDSASSAVDSVADSSGGSPLPYYIALAIGVTVGVIVLGAGAWYARRRWLS